MPLTASPPPFRLDLSHVGDDQLADELRDGWMAPGHRPDGLAVIDLGERRTLPPEAIDELLVTHRASRRAGGRCALVVGPALAAQLALAYPEGVLWASDCEAAVSALGPPRTAAAVTLRRSRRSLHVELSGEIDIAQLPALDGMLSTLHVEARNRRELVFDLTRLSFVDLRALRVLTTAAVRCQLAGARIRVIGAQPQVQRLVFHLGWQEQLPGIDDLPPRTLAACPPPAASRETRPEPSRPMR
jgi:anti-anti-sigma factor